MGSLFGVGGLSCCSVPAFPQFARLLLLKSLVRNRCGADTCVSAGRLGDVELGHEFAVGGARGGEVLVQAHLSAGRDGALVRRLALRLVEHLRLLTAEIDELTAEIGDRVSVIAPSLWRLSAAGH